MKDRRWVPHDLRDEVVDFVVDWSEITELRIRAFLAWLRLSPSKFYRWKQRYGQANEHNSKVPRGFWLEAWERQAILDFQEKNPSEGYRRLTFMMLDRDVAAVSPSSVCRVLRAAGRLDRWNRAPSRKGQGFGQPEAPHRHWHADIAYVNVGGTFYYLISVARLISGNGSAFIARDFKLFFRIAGMTHVRTSPYYPQSNGKLERFHRTIKADAIRRFEPSNPEQARRVVERFVEHYNHLRLHSAIGYVTPADRLAGREHEVWKARDQKLERARAKRRINRQSPTLPSSAPAA